MTSILPKFPPRMCPGVVPTPSPRAATLKRAVVVTLAIVAVSLPQVAWADGEGQGDLDEAMAKRIEADTPAELAEVAALLESAISKGLDEENMSFARKMLGGISLQKGQAIAEQIRRGGVQNFRVLRRDALQSLEDAVKYDETLAEAHLLIARLNALPGGDQQRAREAASAAIKHLGDDDNSRSEALVLRALLQQDEEARLEDLNRAVKADGENVAARQARAMLQSQKGNIEAALEDLMELMKLTPENAAVVGEATRILLRLDRMDEAEKVLTEALAETPQAELYRLRAVIYQSQDEPDKAIDDLAKALTLDPRDFAALLMRAEIYLGQEKVQDARRDVVKALQIEPSSVQGILMRSMLAYEEGRMADAINDMRLLVDNVPDNTGFELQLANFYQIDDRPRKAIEVLSRVLNREADNWRALRLRADARLSTAEHAKAIKDYQAALAAMKDEDDQEPMAIPKSGVLNNLAWVLSTTPKDDLRDGEKALEYALEASELTDYQEAHILSTLAAAYAEKGDFDKAVEWAGKAVERGEESDNEQLEQLKAELESYKEGKPWREEQEVEENAVPILSPEDIIDT